MAFFRAISVVLFLVASIVEVSVSQSTQYYTGATIPNPRTDFAACGNTAASFVCDPHGVLSAAQRSQANRNLESLASETTQNKLQGCDRKGVTAYIILLDKVFADKAASNNDMANFAESASTKYAGDRQCSKDVVVVISRQDRLSYANPGRQLGIGVRQLTSVVVDSPRSQYRAGNFADAIRVIKENLVHEYRTAFTARQQGGGRPNNNNNNMSNRGSNERASETKMPQIPKWVWPVGVAIVVVLLCCCCCCCFCKGLRDCCCPCCAKAPSSGKDFTPSNFRGASMPWGGGGGGGGGGFGNMMGAAGMGALVSRFTSGGGGGGGYGGGGSYNNGGQQPPSYDMGGYTPSAPPKNADGAGGGGDWGAGGGNAYEPSSGPTGGGWGAATDGGGGGGGGGGGAGGGGGGAGGGW